MDALEVQLFLYVGEQHVREHNRAFRFELELCLASNELDPATKFDELPQEFQSEILRRAAVTRPEN